MQTSADRVPRHGSALCADLAEEFVELLPRSVVEAEIRLAQEELAGQVPDGAVDELLHRLVECRLQQRARGSA